MTWLERYLKENPEAVGCDDFIKSIVTDRCPYEFFDDADKECYLDNTDYIELDRCEACWNQQIPGKKEEIDIEEIPVEEEEDEEEIMHERWEKLNEDTEDDEYEVKVPTGENDIQKKLYESFEYPDIIPPSLNEKMKALNDNFKKFIDKHNISKILDSKNDPCTGTFIRDSGNRREFESGAVRDIQEGKGRCDLLPIDVVGVIMHDPVFTYIDLFQDTGDEKHLYDVIDQVTIRHKMFESEATMFLEVAKHFEEGAKKYNENNWRLGIPAHCYIDSAVRHYLKYLRGDTDEHHDRAFCWNILCCIWTCLNKPELNDYYKET